VWHFIPCMQIGLNCKWLLANKGPYCIVRQINDVNFVVKRSSKVKEEIVHIDRLTRYRGTIPQQWKGEIERDTTLGGSDGDDVMNNADEESESEPPDLIEAPGPCIDTSDSGESSLELLNVLLDDMLTHGSESDRGPG